MEEKTSYKRILKSTSIIGGAQVLNILFSIVRTKLIAILVGPTGIALLGIYQSIIDLTRTIFSLGLNFSSIKEIAITKNDSDDKKLTIILSTLKLWTVVTAFMGLSFLILGSEYISFFTFGNINYSLEITILSIAVFFGTFSANQLAIIQGLQEIKLMAQCQLISGFLVTLIAIPIYYYFNEDGVAYSLIMVSIVSFIVGKLFLTRLNVVFGKYTSLLSQLVLGIDMIKLGIFMTINTLISLLSLYYLRAYIAESSDLVSVGMFQASYAIATTYLGLVLSSMLTDFFPRLSANSDNDDLVNRSTNEQGILTLIIGAPVVCLLMVYSELIVKLLYSNEFAGATELLQWRLFSTIFTLISWPVGVILLAKGKGHLSMMHDIVFNATYILSCVLLWDSFGLLSTSYSCIPSVLVSLVILFTLTYKLTGFTYNIDYLKLAMTYIFLIGIIMYGLFSDAEPFYKLLLIYIPLLLTLLVSFLKFNSLFDILEMIKKKRRMDVE